MPLSCPDIPAFFTPGRTYPLPPEDAMSATVSVVEGGELPLPSGRIIACDPLVSAGEPDMKPFTVPVPPGRYPVSASIAAFTYTDSPVGGDGRIAAARLIIRDTPPVAWEMALLPGQELSDLGDEEFYGYGVDAGTGCFADAEANRAFTSSMQEEEPDWLVDPFIENPSHPLKPLILTDPDSGYQLAAFSSGWGDGSYPTWIGRDAAGEVAWVVTDFLVLPSTSGSP